jgi:predicted phage terminase large subunit-like protein
MTRWHEDDLAGRLIEEMKHAGEQWKIVSFPATAEPETNDGIDTLGRKYGEALWPERYNVKELAGLRSAVSERVWNSQYQQRPSTQQGNMILADNILEGNPPEMKAQVRGWDLASTKGKGDFTVGVLVGLGEDGNYWILDVVRKQLATNERDEMIRVTSMVDGMEETIQRFPQDPGAAGKSLVASITRMLSGHRLRFKPISGDKTIRADPMSSQVNQGHFRMIKAEWNSILVDELKMFPNGRHDDIVDALADAFTTLAEETTKRQVTVNWDVF